jgi:hypothetical protein
MGGSSISASAPRAAAPQAPAIRPGPDPLRGAMVSTELAAANRPVAEQLHALWREAVAR